METTAAHAPETKTTEALATPPATKAPTALDADGMAWIPESKFDELQAKTAKLNRRAAKLGCPPIVVEQVEERFVPVRKHNGVEWVTTGYKREVHVRVAGVAPQVAGWTFVARLQHGEGGNIVSKAPSERSTQLDENLWLVDPVCEHCKTKRARKDTFILRDASGSHRQVGRNCLADFLRTADVEMALTFWKYLHEIEIEIASGGDSDDDEGLGGGGFRGRRYWHVESVLNAAASAIRVLGWTSRAAALSYVEASGGFGTGGRATSDTVEWLVDPPRPSSDPKVAEEERRLRKKLAPIERDSKVAIDTLEWIRRRLDPTSDYERNLKVALTGDFIDPRTSIGLVVSAVQAHLRRIGELDRKANPAKRPSQHVGEIGKRLRDLPCKILSTRQIVNDDWTSTLVVFETDDGDQLKWFATGEHEFVVGARVKLTGTVKKHDEWKSTKATLLNRCVVVEENA